MEENKAKIAILSKSNHIPNDVDEENLRKVILPEYKMEHKVFDNASKARTSMIIHESIEYERITRFENNINSTITIRIPRSRRKALYICGRYRQ